MMPLNFKSRTQSLIKYLMKIIIPLNRCKRSCSISVKTSSLNFAWLMGILYSRVHSNSQTHSPLSCMFMYGKKEVSSIKTKSILCVWNRMKATMMMTMKATHWTWEKGKMGCLPLSLSMLSLQFISNGVEQSEPAHPSMQSHRYSPSSNVHWPWREQPFSQPAVNWERERGKKYCDKKGLQRI